MTQRTPKSGEAWWINIVGHNKPRIAHYRGPDHDMPAYWQYMEREVDVEEVVPQWPVPEYDLWIKSHGAYDYAKDQIKNMVKIVDLLRNAAIAGLPRNELISRANDIVESAHLILDDF